jgi:glycine/D-amino acid oxidase-like deaminating enzyme/nitrite reductase/ring-hydroxylating ferredoxin subunit
MKQCKLKSGDSLWAQSGQIRSKPSLKADTSADVCIVGAGIAGLSTAYHLALAGKNVVVLDDGKIGGGQTMVTSAHIASILDRRYYEIEASRGRDAARLAAQSHVTAIQAIESTVQREDLDCDFQRLDGYLFVPPGESPDVLDSEFDAVQRTGAIEVQRVHRAPWPDFDTGPALRFAQQAQFHPIKYMKGLVAAIHRLGGRIHCKTHVTQIEGGEQARITTSHGPIVTAHDVIVATNTPINDLFALHTKQAPYMTYVICARLPADAVPDGLFWDTANPYHYVRLQRDEESPTHAYLLVGGEDHKTGQADDGANRFLRLEHWARERFPRIESVPFHWAGQVMESIDGLAFIGRNPSDKENVFVVTGDSGMGMTHGTIAGLLLRDLILGKENPWTELYNPSRAPLATAASYVQENLNVAAQYTDWLTPGDIDSVEALKPGEGAIMRSGLHKMAVYRDKQGTVCKLSAVCPHLKCVVAWNSAETTWDCPCHGSRFDPHGKVLNGPANSDLAPWPKTEKDE